MGKSNKHKHANGQSQNAKLKSVKPPKLKQKNNPKHIPNAQSTPSPSTGKQSLSFPNSKKSKTGGSLLDKMRQKLQGGHFRWLNEQLYTTEGNEALQLMRDDPSLYKQYHDGFREQTKGWPQRPVDIAIQWLTSRPPKWTVADLGCGDAELSKKVTQKVHSFDLIATAPGVVACNMAKIPLSRNSVDVAVFCLSLMGTDYGSFLSEASRIVHQTGWLWIAEVQSRFVDSTGESVLDEFIEAVTELGFVLKKKNTENSHFLVLEFQGKKGRGDGEVKTPSWPPLRACLYKKR